MPLRDDVDLHSTNGSGCVDRRFSLSIQGIITPYCVVGSSGRVCVDVCGGESVVLWNERCRIDIRSIDD